MVTRALLRSALLALAGASLAAASARADGAQVILALPSVNVSFTALYLAEDLHLWANQGLEVKTLVIPGVGTNNAVINGSVQFAIGSSDALTRAWAHGQHMQAIGAGVKKTMEWVMIRKDIAEAAHYDPNAPLSERAKILKGRKIAVTGIGSLPDAVLRSVAAEAGIHADDMVIPTMLPPEIMAAWKTKAIEGFSNAMPYAQLKNKSGNFIKASLASTSAATNVPIPDDVTKINLTDTVAPDGYPIPTFTWILVYKEQSYDNRPKDKVTAMMKMLWWMVHDGQQYAEPLAYAKLPAGVVTKAEAILKSVTYNGTPVLQ